MRSSPNTFSHVTSLQYLQKQSRCSTIVQQNYRPWSSCGLLQCHLYLPCVYQLPHPLRPLFSVAVVVSRSRTGRDGVRGEVCACTEVCLQLTVKGRYVFHVFLDDVANRQFSIAWCCCGRRCIGRFAAAGTKKLTINYSFEADVGNLQVTSDNDQNLSSSRWLIAFPKTKVVTQQNKFPCFHDIC